MHSGRENLSAMWSRIVTHVGPEVSLGCAVSGIFARLYEALRVFLLVDHVIPFGIYVGMEYIIR